MRIDLLYPRLPPAHDAIGEHAVRLCAALSEAGARTRIVHASDDPFDDSEHVGVVRLDGRMPGAISSLTALVADDPPDWLVVEFNPFSYGPRGLNPRLVVALRRLRRISPKVKIVLHAHEAFVPIRSGRSLVLAVVQRLQFLLLGRTAHRVLMSTERWASERQRWWPRTPTTYVPIGSNLPLSPARDDAQLRKGLRSQLGVRNGETVLVLFGGLGRDRNTQMLTDTLRSLGDRAVFCVYVGPSEAEFGRATADMPCRSAAIGRVDARRAADVLAAADIGIAPFYDGVSARRGSFLAMLQHGLPTVTTSGPLTSQDMSDASAQGAFCLTECDPSDFSRAVGRLIDSPEDWPRYRLAASKYYEEKHSWPYVAARYMTLLGSNQTGSDDARST